MVKALDSLITEYGSISGYNVNLDKSILSGFHIKAEIKSEFLKIIPSKWQKEGMKYLGIRICGSKDVMIKYYANSYLHAGKMPELEFMFPLMDGKDSCNKIVLLPELIFIFSNLILK